MNLAAGLRRMLPLLLGLATFAAPANAAWTRNGVAATAATGDQRFPVAVTDGAGGAYVGWRDPGAGAFLVTHIDAAGDILMPWSPDGLLVAANANADSIVFASDSAGGALACAIGASHVSVFHIHADTTVVVSGVGFGCFMSFQAASADEPGALLISILESICGNRTFFETLRVGSAGTVDWRHSEARSVFDFSTLCRTVALAPDFTRGAYVAARGDSGAQVLLHVTRFDSTGQVAVGWTAVGRALVPGSFSVSKPILVADRTHGVVCLWIESSNAGDRILADWIGGDGIAGPPIPMTDDVSHHRLCLAVSDDAGGVFIVWQDAPLAGGAATLHGLHVDATGAIDAGPAALVPSTKDQALSSLTRDGTGGFYATWTEDGQDNTTPRVNISRFDASLTRTPSWPPGGLLVCDAPGGQDQVCLVVSGGDLLAAWRDLRGLSAAPPTGADVYVAKVTPDGVVGTLCSLAGVQAEPRRVRIRWQSDAGPPVALVLRSADGMGWSERAEVLHDGTGFYDFVDDSVAPGSRWAYRLVTRAGDEMATAVWVDVPWEPALALAGFIAGADHPTIALVLAGSEPARLEVFDVLGRRLASVDLAAPAPGGRQVRLPENVAPGLYILRLTQSETSTTGRGVLLR